MELSDSKRTRGLICLALALVTVAVYWQVTRFAFINYDDPDYVTANPAVKAGLTKDGVIWAFSHFHAGNWHPLTWISHMMDVQLFGMHAGAHHFVNVLFHAANAVLLFLLLDQLTRSRWRSALVAALFALHPLHVESVAWIAERKDVLSTFFGLLSLLAYSKSALQPETQNSKLKTYRIAALICFALSLLSKPMLVTLPFVLLLLDFWPLRRVDNNGWRTFFSPQFLKLALEKKWWFALAAGSCVVTFFAQKAGGAVAATTPSPFLMHVGNPLHSYFLYVAKACWPVHLAVFYPLDYNQPIAPLLLAAVFLIAVSIAAIMTAKRWPFFLMGWLWFLGTLVPVIGFVQVGKQALADRYTYVSLIGLFIAAVWGISDLLRSRKIPRFFGTTVSIVLLGACAMITIVQLKYWQNSITLFTRAIAVTRGNDVAHNNLGSALAELGRKDEAKFHYLEAVQMDPYNTSYQDNLGTALAREGKTAEAIEHYEAAIRADPKFADAYGNLGALLLGQHQVTEALTNLEIAVQLKPDKGESRSNLGNALVAAGRINEALAQYSEAVRLSPNDGTLRLNAGLALMKANRPDDAVVQFAEAVRLNPSSAEARYEFGRQLFFRGKFPEALEQLAEAAKLKPHYASAQLYLAAAEAELGRFDEATAAANLALVSAQQAGQTNLASTIQEALEFFKQGKPLSQKGMRN